MRNDSRKTFLSGETFLTVERILTATNSRQNIESQEEKASNQEQTPYRQTFSKRSARQENAASKKWFFFLVNAKDKDKDKDKKSLRLSGLLVWQREKLHWTELLQHSRKGANIPGERCIDSESWGKMHL